MDIVQQRILLLTKQLISHYLKRSDTNLENQIFLDFVQDLEKSRLSLSLESIDTRASTGDPWIELKYSNIISKLQTLGSKNLPEVLFFLQLIGSKDMDGVTDHLTNFRLQEDQVFGDYIPAPLIAEREERLEAFGDYIHYLHSTQEPSDESILQELPYAFQGLKNEIFTWKSTDKTPIIDIPASIPFPLIGLLHKILEPALIYKHLSQVTTTSRHGTSDKPLLVQALHSAIQKELQNYLALIGVIENEVRRSAVAMIDGKMAFTIRRTYTLLLEATLGLRLMYTIINECESLTGGQILSLLHGYTYSGDEFIARFAKRLIRKVSRPFYNIMDQWLSSGILTDPFKEFFVEIGDENSDWTGRFILNKNKIPSYMGHKVAKTVFETGKSLYFIRNACADHDWIEQQKKTYTAADIEYDTLGDQLQNKYQLVVEHLNELLKNRFFLDLHLQALKDYLLLAKGDFVQLLLEEAAPVLALPGVQLLRHHLTSMLETAIRGSNAHYDSETVLSCLDARMLEMGHGEVGWDLFTLDYSASSPMDIVILDHHSSRQYLKVFNFLWRVKRVCYSLYQSWNTMTIDTRQRATIYGPGHDQNWMVSSRQVCQIMMHLLNELQYYITFEVVEMAWVRFQEKLGLSTNQMHLTVDEIMRAHNEFLATIVQKGLLGGEKGFMGDLHEILKMALLFTESVKEMHKISSRYGDERNSRLDKIHETTLSLRRNFEERVGDLVTKLDNQDDEEMRFLGVRLDFNRYYSTMIKQ